MDIRGASALVTGAGRGIGRAIAVALGRAGARSPRCRARPPSWTPWYARSRLAAARPSRYAADICDPGRARGRGGARRWPRTAACRSWSTTRVSALRAPVAETSDEDWEPILGTNLTAVFRLTRAALPHLSRGGGHVFMISSLAGSNPIAGMAAYCASKAALDHFSHCLMLEVRHQGIKVTTIAPGSVDTELRAGARDAFRRIGLGAHAGRRGGGRARPPAHPRRGPPEPRRDAPAASTQEGVIRRLRNALRIAWRAFMRFQDHHGPDRAAAVAYYMLLSLVPLLIFLISLGVAVLGSFDAAYRGQHVARPGRGHPPEPGLARRPALLRGARRALPLARPHPAGLDLAPHLLLALLGPGAGLRRARPELRQAQPGGAHHGADGRYRPAADHGHDHADRGIGGSPPSAADGG